MNNARQRIEEAFQGIRSDRAPIYDLICNDAVVEHFAGAKLDGSRDREVVVKALGAMLDGTRDMAELVSLSGTVPQIFDWKRSVMTKPGPFPCNGCTGVFWPGLLMREFTNGDWLRVKCRW